MIWHLDTENCRAINEYMVTVHEAVMDLAEGGGGKM